MAEADGLILVVNAGSSSLKLRLLDREGSVVETADLPALSGAADAQLVADAVAGWGSGVEPVAVGHRVVHGGSRFSAPALLDDAVIADIEALTDLAPLHQPKSLAAIEAVRAVLPGVPHVACFDTAFHASMPDAAATYALPLEWRDRWGLRRYGFHGLNHAYVAARAAELSGLTGSSLLDGFRVVTCHLGAGSSLAAVHGGRSVDTTMGFTPLEGLVMATRSGDVDPGLLLWLEREGGLTADELSDGLEHRSGLFGLAGTDDMRVVLAAIDAGSSRARLALDVWGHRLRAGIAAMTASLGGIDALVFTGGIGERSAAARAIACAGLEYLGIDLEPSLNEADSTDDRAISSLEESVSLFVIPAREDIEIARQVRELLAGG